jgi:hypothetical protein
MSYWHCYVSPKPSGSAKKSSKNYFVVNDLSEDQLQKTIVQPWLTGTPFTVAGRIIKTQDEVEEIRITHTNDSARTYADTFNARQAANRVIDHATDRRMLAIWRGEDRTHELLFSDHRASTPPADAALVV